MLVDTLGPSGYYVVNDEQWRLDGPTKMHGPVAGKNRPRDRGRDGAMG